MKRPRKLTISGWRDSLLLLFFTISFSQAQAEIDALLKEAANHNSAAFGNSYIEEKFEYWQKQFPLESFRVDTLLRTSSYDEIWLSQSNSAKIPGYAVALLIRRMPQPAIIDARRLLLKDHARNQSLDDEIIKFVERFAWIYETGKDNFLLDFLFPTHLQVRYRDLNDKKEIAAQLRAQYKRILPVQSINWEREGDRFNISLILDSPLQPLDISLDLQKYLSTYFFELEDKVERVKVLQDSLALWITQPNNTKKQTSQIIAASSAREAFLALLDQEFSDFNVSILDENSNSMSFEASPLPIEGLSPTSLTYRLLAQTSEPGNGYNVRAVWIPNKKLDRYPISISEDGRSIKTPELLQNSKTIFFLNRMVQRYGSLGQSSLFQPEAEPAARFQGHLILHKNRNDSLNWDMPEIYSNLLSKLSRGKQAYFFPRSVSQKGGLLAASGYVFWRDRGQLWHHMAKIQESYQLVDYSYQLTGAAVDLFPFIRVENVKEFWGIMEGGKVQKNTIIIAR